MPAPNPIRLPRLDGSYDPKLRAAWDDAMRAIESELAGILASAGSSYTVSNGTGSRALNVSTATTAQTADVLATLISDLKKKGQVA